MNGEADYYWPSSAQFTAVLHAIQNHTNLHEQNELDRYQPIVKILCSSLSSNWFWASIILSSRLLGLVSTAGCCCRPPGRLDWHKANGFWERQSHQQILRPCHEGSFFEYVHQGNCNAAKQQLKLPRSLTVFAIFCQSIMWPKKFHFSFGKSQSEYWHRSGSQIVIDFNVMSELRVFVQNSWGCSKKNLTG